MKILSAETMRQLDAFTIKKEPITSIDLMERASIAFVENVFPLIPKNKTIAIFCGTGNNGGDGLAIARLLSEKEIECHVYTLENKHTSEDFLSNLERWDGFTLKISSINEFPDLLNYGTIIDALFGSGLNRPVEGLAAEIITCINVSPNKVFSVDLPSGLFCDATNSQSEYIVEADQVITFQAPKKSFFYNENQPYMSEFKIADIGLDQEFINSNDSQLFYTTAKEITPLIKSRDKFSHKGTFGHALFIGGSYGKIGAARLAAEACLRAGVGLLTAFVPKCAYVIMQSTIPECMLSTAETVSTVSSLPEIRDYQAIAIGPGLSQENDCLETLAILLISSQKPLVMDADALNLLAANPHLLIHLPENSILTPHFKEFERLTSESNTTEERLKKATEFAQKNKVILVLKGAFTAVCLPNGEIHFNSTGNPGMATAGSGDVLTGIILSLVAQGYSPKDAAILGVYKHGEAGDKGAENLGQSGLLARDIISNLRID